MPTGDPTPQAGAVLYAADMACLASFYGQVCGLRAVGSGEDYVILESVAFQLVIRQVPREIAETIGISVPPKRRSNAAAKLVFFVRDMETARHAAAACGGVPEESAKPWTIDGWTVWDILDPEGNVIQLRARGRTHRSQPET